MSLQLWSLASGSSGNAFLIRGGRTCVLLDCGQPMRTVRDKIASVGQNPLEVQAVLLTHEHSDHCSGAGPMCRALKAPLVANSATLEAASRIVGSTNAVEMSTGSVKEIGDLVIRSFPVSHDAIDPVGYVFEYRGARACYATDTGTITPAIASHIMGARLLILESNHDVARLRQSRYPAELKRRIMGDRGHLSNVVTARAIASYSKKDQPCVVWLAHLSEENNTERLAMTTARNALIEAKPANIRLALAKRGVVSVHWNSADNWWQPSLF
jgi:phosphoribosyl 1,2-cyclic phosphodiesterase